MARSIPAALAALLALAAPLVARADPPRRPPPIVIVLDPRLGNAPAWISEGRALLRAGKVAEALPLAEKAVAKLDDDKALEHPVALAEALTLLADLREARGEYPAAAALFERTEQLWALARSPDDIRVARALTGQGRCYASIGNYDKAVPRMRRALAVAEKSLAPDGAAYGDFVELLGELLDESGAPDEALPLLQKALTIYENAQPFDPIRVADALHNLGARSAELGRVDEAERMLQRSATLREQALGPDDLDLGQTLEALGVLAASRHDDRASMALEERAAKIYERRLGPTHPALIIPTGNIALAKLVLGDPRGAEQAYARALGLAEQQMARVLGSGSDREKLAFLATVGPLGDSYLTLFLRRWPRDPGLVRLGFDAVLRLKGRALDATAGSMELLRKRAPAGTASLLDALKDAKRKLSALSTGGASGEAAQRDKAALTAQIEALEARVSDVTAALRADAHPETAAALAAHLPERGALVEIFAYVADRGFGREAVPRYAAFVLAKNGEVTAIDLGDAKAIDDKIKAFHDALSDPKRDDVSALGRALDEVLMRPLRPAIAGAERIFLSPDRAANLVPFEALVDEDNHALIERYTFTYLASGRDLSRFAAHAPASRSGPLVVANPAFDQGPSSAPPGEAPDRRGYAIDALRRMRFGPLAGTAAEGATIAELLPGAKLLTGPDATKAALFASHGPAIVHIATHGFFLPPPDGPAAGASPIVSGRQRRAVTAGSDTLLRSGLAFSGANARDERRAEGIMTALEAAGLDLEGTRLVTLSACETGLGEIQGGEGVHGLRRALTIAGAETMVMSLWKVDDAATRDLMIGYYRRLRRGEGRSDALRAAKLEMRAQARTAHPYAWASFIVSGDPSPIEGMTGGSLGGTAPTHGGCACELVTDRAGDDPPVALLALAAALALRRKRRP
ncbi:MAG: CHAT domain-containing tetratricopeptide repeat protein [Byssovorax sp.]